jgi:uncharacterized protein
MAGETNLSALLKSMKPILLDEEYVFCTIKTDDSSISRRMFDFDLLSLCEPIGIFQEQEGTTYIVTRQNAEKANLSYSLTTIFRMITLSVHSSLDAVGFLAAITNKLAAAGISCNPVSAYYHDHLFIPANRAEQAMNLLKEFCE